MRAKIFWIVVNGAGISESNGLGIRPLAARNYLHAEIHTRPPDMDPEGIIAEQSLGLRVASCIAVDLR